MLWIVIVLVELFVTVTPEAFCPIPDIRPLKVDGGGTQREVSRLDARCVQVHSFRRTRTIVRNRCGQIRHRYCARSRFATGRDSCWSRQELQAESSKYR